MLLLFGVLFFFFVGVVVGVGVGVGVVVCCLLFCYSVVGVDCLLLVVQLLFSCC